MSLGLCDLLGFGLTFVDGRADLNWVVHGMLIAHVV